MLRQQLCGYQRIVTLPLLLVFTLCFTGGCKSSDSEYIYAESGIRLLYGEGGSRQQAMAIFAEHAAEDAVCRAYHLAEARRLAAAPAEAERCRKQLQEIQELLAEKISRQPSAVEAFALAELLSLNYAFYYDSQLAEVLYSYSAAHGFSELVKASGRQRTAVHKPLATQMTQALQQPDWQAKLSGVYKALESGYWPAALALAVIYSTKPHLQLGMAVNSALLAGEYSRQQAQAEEVLLELDRSSGCALALLVMNENLLKTPRDLSGLHQDRDFALTLLLTEKTRPQGYNLIRNQAAGDITFLRSGAIFDLPQYNYPAAELKKLIQSSAGNNKLYAYLTGALLAGELNDGAWQLASAEQIFAHLAGSKVPPLQPDLRHKLITAVPGVAHLALPEPEQQLHRQLLSSRILWNIAVYMKVNALLQLGRPDSAQQFLQTHQRHRLDGILPQLERNLIRRFAPRIAVEKN